MAEAGRHDQPIGKDPNRMFGWGVTDGLFGDEIDLHLDEPGAFPVQGANREMEQQPGARAAGSKVVELAGLRESDEDGQVDVDSGLEKGTPLDPTAEEPSIPESEKPDSALEQ